MSAFASLPLDVTSYGSPPQLDSRIDELQKFLLGNDWSTLSSLSPPSAPAHAVADILNSWPSLVYNAPLPPRSIETAKPSTMLSAASVDAPATVSEADQIVAAPAEPALSTPSTVDSMSDSIASMASYSSALTPLHRQSFDTRYSDSVGSPDSERDFLTSPSMFDDADFEFDADASTFPLFNDQPFEDPVESTVDDPVSVFASNFENVKLEAGEKDTQSTDIDLNTSQSTLMPSQSQVKVEDDVYDAPSTLVAALKTEADYAKLEPKHEEVPWTSEDHKVYHNVDDIKTYFNDEEDKAAALSNLANADAHAFAQDLSKYLKETFGLEEEQKTSQVGPVRPSRGNRERRTSPTKATPVATSDSASPAPFTFIDPATNSKRWQCLECGKLFDRAFNLKTHRYTHENPETRARPFVCPDDDCQKQFARKHDMQRHFENVHRGESRGRRGGSVKRSRANDMG